MKYTIELHRERSLGDHGERVVLAYEARPGESVERLMERVGLEKPTDWLVIRLAVFSKGEPR